MQKARDSLLSQLFRQEMRDGVFNGVILSTALTVEVTRDDLILFLLFDSQFKGLFTIGTG